MLIGRRLFSIAALALVGGVTIAIGCGSAPNNPTSPTATAPAPEGQVIGVVTDSHAGPHSAVISAAQLSAGVGITLDMYNGFHSHTVILTGPQIMQIAGRAHVSVDSSINPHSNGAEPHAHTVTFY